ncbi:exported hypothetical protein [Vibrio crassostreae]|uniref:Uncharacterized protein n=1 Tax=Vibrio crassostreae TaxID=246167 RepID=A0A822N2Y8_9VIBR|nr:exported hypothetical protein [Vibrio crassostreae]CDT56508.1 exported hypothetical protein [Vibrio crassostreae]CDT63127.1 exported hypothetical protein [Vibrio crassostreae]
MGELLSSLRGKANFQLCKSLTLLVVMALGGKASSNEKQGLGTSKRLPESTRRRTISWMAKDR